MSLDVAMEASVLEPYAAALEAMASQIVAIAQKLIIRVCIGGALGLA